MTISNVLTPHHNAPIQKKTCGISLLEDEYFQTEYGDFILLFIEMKYNNKVVTL